MDAASGYQALAVADDNIEHRIYSSFRRTISYAITLVGVAIAYVAATTLSLEFASIHPNAVLFWPPTGLAFAAIVLCGYRVWPAVFIGALIANATTAESIIPSIGVAVGDTLQAVVAGYLLVRFSSGRNTFDTPTGIAKFALISLASTMIGATIDVGGLGLAGSAEFARFASGWLKSWASDWAGAVLVAPVIVLWVTGCDKVRNPKEVLESAAIFGATGAIGLIAFSPLVELANRGSLAFLAVPPLMWAALRRGKRDTATAALIIVCLAAWAATTEGGSFGQTGSNQALWLNLIFLIGTVLPALALSAFVTIKSEEKKRLEAKLDEGRTQLAEAERLADVGSWVWEIPEGRVIWSDQLSSIYGRRPEHVEGTFEDFLQQVHQDDRTRVQTQFSQALVSGQTFQSDMRIIRPEGEVRYLRTCGEMIRDGTGIARRMLGASQDVTDLKQTEHALEKAEKAYHTLVERVRDYATRNVNERRETQTALEQAREQLAQSQKMEAVGQLTGGVAHDFNNLLTIIVGNLEIAQRSLDNWTDGTRDRVRRVINNAMRGAQRGASLTQRLLAFSRRQPLDPKVLDPNKLLTDMSDFLRRSLGETINLEMTRAAALWRIEADPVQLEAALLNLAVNARDAMPEGGKLTIETRNTFLDENYCRKNAEVVSGHYVEIAVSDTGEGMSRQVLGRVFEPFFTTKAVGQGTGLGLSQVYGFIKQSGGHVQIYSQIGDGTTVKLYLPRLLGDFREEEAREDDITEQVADTILIVEDDHDVRTYVGEILRELNYRVFEAHDSESALALLNRNDIRVDLLLSDVVLPGLNGRQLADEMKIRQPGAQVLFMTGYARNAIVHDGRLDPGVQMIQKPFTKDDLAARVRDLLDADAGESRLSTEPGIPETEPLTHGET